MLIRRLRCGTPQYWASCVLHATLHPSPSIPPAFVHFCLSGSRGRENPGSAMRTASSSTAPKSPNPSLKLLLNAPGTFSQTIYRGRTSSPVRPMLLSCSLISLTIRICSMYKPERAPARPARFPAMLKSWQGLPPVMHQTGSTSAPLIFVISPKCFKVFFSGLPSSGMGDHPHTTGLPPVSAKRYTSAPRAVPPQRRTPRKPTKPALSFLNHLSKPQPCSETARCLLRFRISTAHAQSGFRLCRR